MLDDLESHDAAEAAGRRRRERLDRVAPADVETRGAAGLRRQCARLHSARRDPLLREQPQKFSPAAPGIEDRPRQPADVAEIEPLLLGDLGRRSPEPLFEERIDAFGKRGFRGGRGRRGRKALRERLQIGDPRVLGGVASPELLLGRLPPARNLTIPARLLLHRLAVSLQGRDDSVCRLEGESVERSLVSPEKAQHPEGERFHPGEPDRRRDGRRQVIFRAADRKTHVVQVGARGSGRSQSRLRARRARDRIADFLRELFHEIRFPRRGHCPIIQ